MVCSRELLFLGGLESKMKRPKHSAPALSFTVDNQLPVSATELEKHYRLVDVATNPHVISGFLLVYGQCLMLTGAYARSIEIARQTANAANHFGLKFVIPYALTIKAFALFGRRSIGGLRSLITPGITMMAAVRFAWARRFEMVTAAEPLS